MRDTLTCYVSDKLEPLYFRKAAEEGKRYTVDEAWFSYDDGIATVKQRRTWHNPVREPQEMEYSDSRCIFDMLSILAQARSYNPKDYKIGQKILFPMATGRRVEEQTLIYRGKEDIEANNDTIYRCLVFSFVEYKKGKEKEVITFFVSDDKNHLPIRLDMYLNFGLCKSFPQKCKGKSLSDDFRCYKVNGSASPFLNTLDSNVATSFPVLVGDVNLIISGSTSDVPFAGFGI